MKYPNDDAGLVQMLKQRACRIVELEEELSALKAVVRDLERPPGIFNEADRIRWAKYREEVLAYADRGILPGDHIERVPQWKVG